MGFNDDIAKSLSPSLRSFSKSAATPKDPDTAGLEHLGFRMRLDGAIAVWGNSRNWPTHPMRDLLRRTKDLGYPDLPLLGVSLAEGVRPRTEDDGRPAASLDLSAYKRVREGDIIMNALGKPHGSIGRSPQEGITSPAYWVMETSTLADSRFLHYLLRSEHMVNEYQRLGKYLPPNQFDISWESFRDIEIPLPPVEEQRRIADFLDDQVARIDRSLSTRDRQLEMLSRLPIDRVRHDLEVVAKDHESVPLRRVLREIVIGSTPSEDLSVADGGLEWFTPASIDADGRLQEPVRYIDGQAAQAAGLRQFPAPSVLLVGIGSAGKVSRLDKPASGNQQLSCLVPGPRIHRDYLHFVLRALKDSVLGTAPFTTLPILNNDTVGSIRVPLPALDCQARLVASWERQEAELLLVKGAMLSQIGLLEERKRSLITSAVTGELDVTTARPIGMGKWVPNVRSEVEAPAKAQASSIGGIG